MSKYLLIQTMPKFRYASGSWNKTILYAVILDTLAQLRKLGQSCELRTKKTTTQYLEIDPELCEAIFVHQTIYKYNMVLRGVVKITGPEVLDAWDYFPTKSGGK